MKVNRSEGKWSDGEEASGSKSEIQNTESFIYPFEKVKYIKI